MTTVLILVDDPGLVFWLAELLGSAGYETWPALRAPEAMAFMQRFTGKIDLLIVNPAQTGVADFVEFLRQSQDNVRVLALSDQEVPELPEVNAAMGRPDPSDQNSGVKWLSAVDHLMVCH